MSVSRTSGDHAVSDGPVVVFAGPRSLAESWSDVTDAIRRAGYLADVATSPTARDNCGAAVAKTLESWRSDDVRLVGCAGGAEDVVHFLASGARTDRVRQAVLIGLASDGVLDELATVDLPVFVAHGRDDEAVPAHPNAYLVAGALRRSTLCVYDHATAVLDGPLRATFIDDLLDFLGSPPAAPGGVAWSS